MIGLRHQQTSSMAWHRSPAFNLRFVASAASGKQPMITASPGPGANIRTTALSDGGMTAAWLSRQAGQFSVRTVSALARTSSSRPAPTRSSSPELNPNPVSTELLGRPARAHGDWSADLTETLRPQHVPKITKTKPRRRCQLVTLLRHKS
jgi:cellulase/cellobiase CelA1